MKRGRSKAFLSVSSKTQTSAAEHGCPQRGKQKMQTTKFNVDDSRQARHATAYDLFEVASQTSVYMCV